ncbi:MAG: Mov34/MPN/PAD-1 family protein [Candidatus Eisenbacteria bacterium]|jgi:integrative and conjugative element protein (TIGR02256 family)
MTSTFIVARTDYDGMVEEALAHRGMETGGTGLGVRRGNEIIKVFNVPAGPGARRARARYTPDTRWQEAVVRVIRQRLPQLTYVSDWHVHPDSFDEPSSIDRDTARRVVSETEWDAPAVVFPIAVIEEGRVRFRAYLMTREVLEFEEIPFLVVPDNDPRMMAALTGMDAIPMEASNEGREAHDPGGEQRGGESRGMLRRIAAHLWNRPARRGRVSDPQ